MYEPAAVFPGSVKVALAAPPLRVPLVTERRSRCALFDREGHRSGVHRARRTGDTRVQRHGLIARLKVAVALAAVVVVAALPTVSVFVVSELPANDAPGL